MSATAPQGKPEDRRKFLRLNVGISTTYELLPAGVSNRTTARNISESGVLLSVLQPIEPGTRMHIEVPLPGRPQPIKFVGEVRWCRPQPPEEQKLSVPLMNIGVEFVEIAPQDVLAIAQFVEAQLKLQQGPSH